MFGIRSFVHIRVLIAAALLLSLSWAAQPGGPANAQTLPVPCATSSLIDFMNNAASPDTYTPPNTLNLASNCTYILTDQNGNDVSGVSALPLVINDLTINGNGSSIRLDGGANFRILTMTSTGILTLNNLTLLSGTQDMGGAIYARNQLTLSNVAIANNSARVGGGIFIDGATVNISNSTFSGNSSANNFGQGAAIYNNGGTLNLTNVTIANNTAPSGASLAIPSGSATLKNTLVAQTAGGSNCSFGVTITGVKNMADDSSCTGGFTTVTRDSMAFAALANYGGYVQTVALLPGNPAIHAGDTTTCNAAPIGNVDQRGIPRISGGDTTCDVGAFESRAFNLTLASGSNQTAETGHAFPAPLTVSVTSPSGDPVNGGVVTFTGPASGAGITPTSALAAITAGAAGFTPTANETVGGYNVMAGTAGAAGIATFPSTNVYPVPGLSSISPAWTQPGSPSLAVTVSGSNFSPASEVRVNGAGRPTTYVNATHLTVQLPPSDLASEAILNLTVFTPAPAGGTSNMLHFYVAATQPGAISTVTIAGPSQGTTGANLTFTATVEPSSAATPFDYAWSPEPASGQGTASATYRWSTGGTKSVSITVANSLGPVNSQAKAVEITLRTFLYLPVMGH
jgi:hypothetical protein